MICCSGCRNISFPSFATNDFQNVRYCDTSRYIDVQRTYAYGASVASIVVIWCQPDIIVLHDALYQQRTGSAYLGEHPHAFVLMMPYDAHAYIQTRHRSGAWGVTLIHGNRVIPASYVYQTHLDPEYRYILGSYYNQFYDVYAVTFFESPQNGARLVVSDVYNTLRFRL